MQERTRITGFCLRRFSPESAENETLALDVTSWCSAVSGCADSAYSFVICIYYLFTFVYFYSIHAIVL